VVGQQNADIADTL